MRSARHPILPWAVWGVAALAYAIAVINRSSLSALGTATQHHFGVEATALSMFPVLQLVVYAALQIPVGMLLDKLGPTVLILAGGVLMGGAQVLMATAPDVTIAILARVLVGAGDACTFISVIKMLPEWFSLRQLPVMNQLTSFIGQAGQLVSVTPLALFVGAVGWTSGFLGVAAVTLVMVIAGFAVIRDRPGTGTALERLTGRSGRLTRESRSLSGETTAQIATLAPPSTGLVPVLGGQPRRGFGFFHTLRRVLHVPGVRLAYWLHFTAPMGSNVFLLLWGVPFLTGGAGLSSEAANGLLSLAIASLMAGALLLGPVTSRFAAQRIWIYVGMTAVIACTWIVVLLWPGTPPMWLLVVLAIIVAQGGPASMIAFDVARTHTPRSFSGFATGLVNTGGFTSTLVVLLGIGLTLDLMGAGSPENYSLGPFKAAFALQIPLWALGIGMIVWERRRTARWMAEHGRTLG